ncbi:hypothetical protein STEG23_032480, partial [Scotinomys teguina]
DTGHNWIFHCPPPALNINEKEVNSGIRKPEGLDVNSDRATPLFVCEIQRNGFHCEIFLSNSFLFQQCVRDIYAGSISWLSVIGLLQASGFHYTINAGPLTRILLGYPVVNLYCGDHAALRLQVRPLHLLQQIIDGVDVEQCGTMRCETRLSPLCKDTLPVYLGSFWGSRVGYFVGVASDSSSGHNVSKVTGPLALTIFPLLLQLSEPLDVGVFCRCILRGNWAPQLCILNGCGFL